MTGQLPRDVETVVVGGGQAGLAMSFFLSRAGQEHVVLERRSRLGGAWQDRWDNFCLVTPNWSASLPGFAYDGRDPNGFMPRDEIRDRIAAYARAISAPVVLEAGVSRLAATSDGFALETVQGEVRARNVVVAIGGYHRPKMPGAASRLPARVAQLHSHDYRNEASLPSGAVLVVGSGQSGVQIAEELHEAGRRVFLSVGTAGRMPRRYRGRDVFEWFRELGLTGPRYGFGMPTVATLPDPRFRLAGNAHLSGRKGGHDTNLRQMALDGITLVGHLEGIDGERVEFAPDLSMNLTRADRFFDERLRPIVDGLIEAAGIDAGPDDRVTVDFEPPAIERLNLAEEGISTVIWTSGYRLDLGWIDLPILDEMGYPRHVRGVTEIPGLYFLGLPWMHTQTSATLLGVGFDARHIAQMMGLEAPVPQPA